MRVPSRIAKMQVFEQLVQRLAPGGRLVRAWPLAGGISAQMTALSFVANDGRSRRAVVRQAGDAALEYRLLSLTHALGLPTPAPLLLDTSGALFATPYLVLEYIEGAPVFARSATADGTLALAAQLAAIHGADVARLDVSFLGPYPAVPGIGARRAVADEVWQEARIRDVLEPAWPLGRRNAPALLHGDYWPGNFLWRDGRLVGIVDWEDAALDDPLIDLAIARLDLAWIWGLDAMRDFSAQYMARMALDYSDLPYWDLFAALRLMRMAAADLDAWAAFFTPFGRPDITAQSIRAVYDEFVAQALGALMV